MAVSSEDYVDAMIILERSVRQLQNTLPNKQHDAASKAAEQIYQAVLALDLYLMRQMRAPQNTHEIQDR